MTFSSFSGSKNARLISAFALAIFFIAAGWFFSGDFSKRVDGAIELAAAGPKGGGGGQSGGGRGDVELCGFAWAATSESPAPKSGIGWVSFNSKDCDADGNGNITNPEAQAVPGCPSGHTGSYEVKLSPDKKLTGYAWSSNVGWIKFGGLTGNPTNPANGQTDAVLLGDGTVAGWARACSGTSSGDCSTMNSRTDGWDGWISLKGSNYGVTYDAATQRFAGYAWGGPVMGWMRWDQSSGPAAGKGVRGCFAVLAANTPPIINLIGGNPIQVTVNNSFNDPGAEAYDIEDGNLTGQIVVTGSVNTAVLGSYTKTYTVTDFGDPPQTGVNKLSAQVSRTINVVSGSTPNPGDLNITCSVTSPAILNRPVTWTATITNPPSGFPNYTYTFDFDDGLSPDPAIVGPTTSSIASVARVYTTLGPKRLQSVTVTDETSGATGFCPPLNANVITSPIIIER